MNLKDVFTSIKYCAISTIQKLVERECTNEEKKKLLDAAVKERLEYLLNQCNTGFIIKLLISKFVLPYIPEITQFIYDLIKTKVIGVTKENG